MILLEEDPPSLSGKRVIVYVIPDYSVPNLDPRTFNVLQKCKILPPDLRLYSKTGFREDQRVIHELFGKGYTTLTLSGEVHSDDMLSQIEMVLTTDNPSLLVFVYCGHGCLKTHGYELVLPYNHRVSKEDIEGILSKTNYQGTYVQLLNICSDQKQTSLDVQASTSFKYTPSPKYHGVSVIGVNSPRDMCDQYNGSAFLKTLQEFKSGRDTMTYGDFRDLHVCNVSFTNDNVQGVKVGNSIDTDFSIIEIGNETE